MPHGDVETFHRDGAWHNRIEGDTDVLDTHPTKVDAVAAGRDVARERKAEHIIKDENGRIAERNSYGNDPRSSKG